MELDRLLQANASYAAPSGLASPPARRIAVVACMDARLHVEAALGLADGDAHVIRNAGGIVTDDVLRSLIVSHHLLGTRTVLVVGHTDCGMTSFVDAELRARLVDETGTDADAPSSFLPFGDVAASVTAGVERIRTHPWLGGLEEIAGGVYDVATGRISPV